MQEKIGIPGEGGDHIEGSNPFEEENARITDMLERRIWQNRAVLDNFIKNPTALLFLFVSGIYSSLYGSISTSKVANYLQVEYEIEKEVVDNALGLLFNEGWIMPKKGGRGWFELSRLGAKVYQEMLKTSEQEIISETATNKIRSQLKNQIALYTPQYPIRNMAKLKRRKQMIGWDFLIKIDEGEEDRILHGLNELQAQRALHLIFPLLLASCFAFPILLQPLSFLSPSFPRICSIVKRYTTSSERFAIIIISTISVKRASTSMIS